LIASATLNFAFHIINR